MRRDFVLVGLCLAVLVPAASARAQDPVIAAAGDIACDPAGASFNGGNGTADRCRQMHTSNLLVGQGLAAVLPLGDTQYEEGTLTQFNGSYEPSWGRVRSISHPVIGNHEYRDPATGQQTATGDGYWDYFNGVGNNAGPAGERGKGWYSYDIGNWHLIALNSMCDRVAGGCGAGSEQEQWLRADLAANADAACTLAYWHHPLFNSGPEGSFADTPWNTTALWQALWEAGADVVLTAHSHVYERFAPQNAQGVADPQHGLREFIVGTGGVSLGNNGVTQPNSELRNNTWFGVLRLTLHANSYDWAFQRDTGDTMDSGSGQCHGAPDLTPPDTSLSAAPQGVITQRDASFSFNSSEAGSSFRCRLDGPGSTTGPETSCGSSQSYSGLADGAYTFFVYSVDQAGNSDASPATQSFSVDATAPDTSLSSGLPAATTSRTASFAFTSPEAGSSFECRLDSGAWGACSSPSERTGLSRGRHTFEVRALDVYGNADASPASQSWSIRRPPTYRPASYELLSGAIFDNRGGLRRLFRNDGRRLEVEADRKRSGNYLAAFEAFAEIPLEPLASLRDITIDYNGGSSARDAEIKVHVFKFETRRWVRLFGPRSGLRDRSFERSPAGLTSDFVSGDREVRIRVTGKGAGPFRARTDLLTLTVEY